MENLRSCRDVEVIFNDYTCFVRPNGAGKSTILFALNIFFRQSGIAGAETSVLQEEDFHNRHTDDPIRITVTFGDLNAAAKKDLAHYVRQEQLVVTAVAKYDHKTRCAQVIQYGQRLVVRAFASFFEAIKDKVPVSDLKKTYATILESHPSLPPTGTKAGMEEALRSYEENHVEECELLYSEHVLLWDFARQEPSCTLHSVGAYPRC